MPDVTPGQLATALDLFAAAVADVPSAQWATPTICAPWTVTDLVTHVVAGTSQLAGALSGQRPAPLDLAALPTACHDAGTALLAALAVPDALAQTVTVPFGNVPAPFALHLRLTELLVHGWDLAQATGHRLDYPAALAEQELLFSRAAVARIPPERSPFAPPQPAAGDAPPLDRLAALLGRTLTP